MAEQTNIEWADDTFNPWIGCTKISDACDFCYAEDWSKRYGRAQWGNHPRQRTGASTWAQPLKWNRQAKEAGKPRFVFCASLADVFDNQVPKDWRADLWSLIRECDSLTWLLLTKRPQNIAKMLPADWGTGWPHVWLGTTVEHQEAADRNIRPLLSVPAARRFLSCEPLLGPIDLTAISRAGAAGFMRPLDGRFRTLDWVIAGGESSPNARPSHPDWFRSLRDQCAAANVPFLFKQWGEWKPWHAVSAPYWESPAGGREDRHQLLPPDIDNTVSWNDGLAFVAKDEAHYAFQRVGKKRAGRVLDGVTHDGRPEA